MYIYITCTLVYIRVFIYIYTCIYISIYICIHINICIYVYIYLYVYIYISYLSDLLSCPCTPLYHFLFPSFCPLARVLSHTLSLADSFCPVCLSLSLFLLCLSLFLIRAICIPSLPCCHQCSLLSLSDFSCFWACVLALCQSQQIQGQTYQIYK